MSMPEPVVTLPLRRADEKVAGVDQLVEHRDVLTQRHVGPVRLPRAVRCSRTTTGRRGRPRARTAPRRGPGSAAACSPGSARRPRPAPAVPALPRRDSRTSGCRRSSCRPRPARLRRPRRSAASARAISKARMAGPRIFSPISSDDTHSTRWARWRANVLVETEAADDLALDLDVVRVLDYGREGLAEQRDDLRRRPSSGARWMRSRCAMRSSRSARTSSTAWKCASATLGTVSVGSMSPPMVYAGREGDRFPRDMARFTSSISAGASTWPRCSSL